MHLPSVPQVGSTLRVDETHSLVHGTVDRWTSRTRIILLRARRTKPRQGGSFGLVASRIRTASNPRARSRSARHRARVPSVAGFHENVRISSSQRGARDRNDRIRPECSQTPTARIAGTL